MTSINLKQDYIGAVASALCLLHCIATPFLFVAKACSAACCIDSPLWWQIIDYVFIIISFQAIYTVTKSSTNRIVNIAFWMSWILLFFMIINHTTQVIYIRPELIYVPAIFIIALHIYNYKFCRCEGNQCCISE